MYSKLRKDKVINTHTRGVGVGVEGEGTRENSYNPQ